MVFAHRPPAPIITVAKGRTAHSLGQRENLSAMEMLQQSRPLVREPAVESKNADAGPADFVNGNSLCELVRPAVQRATD